jgi:molybdopterin converting factor subunit 1
MKCRVLFFAAAAQVMECREKEITMPIGSSVGEAFDLLASEHNALAALSSTCALALEGQLVQREMQLSDGCTIAILPPVSGG